MNAKCTGLKNVHLPMNLFPAIMPFLMVSNQKKTLFSSSTNRTKCLRLREAAATITERILNGKHIKVILLSAKYFQDIRTTQIKDIKWFKTFGILSRPCDSTSNHKVTETV